MMGHPSTFYRVIGKATLATLLIVSLPACVPLQTYDKLKGDFEKEASINRDLVTQLKNAQSALSVNGLKGELSQSSYDKLSSEKAGLQKENAAMRETIAKLQEQIRNLPPPTAGNGFTPTDAKDIGAEFNAESGGLVLPENVLFAPGQWTIKKGPQSVLDHLADLIKSKYSDHIINIDGHTDPTPIKHSRNADNWELGAKRAHAVFQYFAKHGIPMTDMVIHSYGYSEPPSGADPKTKEGRAACRRVEVRLGSVRLPK